MKYREKREKWLGIKDILRKIEGVVGYSGPSNGASRGASWSNAPMTETSRQDYFHPFSIQSIIIVKVKQKYESTHLYKSNSQSNPDGSFRKTAA